MSEITNYLPGFIAAYAILVVAASSPGPAVALLVGLATERGRAPALIATLGISFGSVTINILTLLGVGILLSQAAWAMTALRVFGACYLLYLAWGAFGKAIRPPQLAPAESASAQPVKIFMTGYLLQVTNPKAIAFWLAIASVGAVENADLSIIALFVTGAFIISYVCHGAWAVALSAPPVRAAYTASRRWVESALGCFFCLAAWKLATSER